ncbi:putative GTPase [Handroanthus impetiginosus]|uniref:Putative GTPase n=1 Tax=Handroanthus impetiginosus TaxID=429701 RepID=A0A2G9GDQ4_9LAMI|nr:putative GTPase [Handroanthus impetiginosus]
MFLTHKFPRIHSHFLIPPLAFSKPHKLFLRTSALVSKAKVESESNCIPSSSPLSHFSTLIPAAVAPPQLQEQESLQLSLESLFLPPETDVSSLKNSTLSARILKGSNIVLSKYAEDGVEVVNAEFVKSSVRTEDCPSDGLPEFALVGRSNVGKSSLLNSLVRRKRLALTSKKPGKTQCINHFRVNDSWYLVDLPGYGYAAAPHELRTDWDKFTKDYFLNRPTLVSVFLLIDASIPAKKIDLEYASWLGQNKIPMTLIFTKCDKRKKKKNGGKRPEENVQDFQDLIRDFFQTAPPWIMTSSVTNQGRDEILLHMSQLQNYWLKH